MSANSSKGYIAEHLIELYLQHLAPGCYRPRAGASSDKGDIEGLPFVVSVKNHARMDLGEWLTDAIKMRRNAKKDLAVVWHKRRNRGHPRDWYVTMTGQDFFVLAQLYCEEVRRVAVSSSTVHEPDRH
jgi:hypothetical protein